MKFRDKLARFFYGRYGIDGLYYALFVTYFIIWFVLLFIDFIPVRLGLYALQTAVIVWMFYRVLSKNIWARRRENEVYLKARRAISRFLSGNTSKKTKSPQKQSSKAKKIYTDFIEKEAPKEINIAFETKTLTAQNIQEAPCGCFTSAQKRVYSLMGNNSNPRF